MNSCQLVVSPKLQILLWGLRAHLSETLLLRSAGGHSLSTMHGAFFSVEHCFLLFLMYEVQQLRTSPSVPMRVPHPDPPH